MPTMTSSEYSIHQALMAEIERLRAELAECAAALPGVYYMDPPDGGDVSVSEQLRRMAKDAERYRLLRRKFAIISDGEGHAEFCAINLPRPTYIAPSSAIELDTALDRERLIGWEKPTSLRGEEDSAYQMANRKAASELKTLNAVVDKHTIPRGGE